MPGTSNVERKKTGQVEAKKVGKFRAVVLGGAAEQGLDQEERRHDKKEPGAGSLCGCKRDGVRCAKRKMLVFASVPAEKVPSAERGEQEPCASEKCDQGEHAPDQGVGGGVISDQWFRRPIVRIGVIEIGTQSGRGPS